MAEERKNTFTLVKRREKRTKKPRKKIAEAQRRERETCKKGDKWQRKASCKRNKQQLTAGKWDGNFAITGININRACGERKATSSAILMGRDGERRKRGTRRC